MYMMKSLISSFISENFWAPQQESNPCLPIAGTVVLPLDYRVSDRKLIEEQTFHHIYPSLQNIYT